MFPAAIKSVLRNRLCCFFASGSCDSSLTFTLKLQQCCNDILRGSSKLNNDNYSPSKWDLMGGISFDSVFLLSWWHFCWSKICGWWRASIDSEQAISDGIYLQDLLKAPSELAIRQKSDQTNVKELFFEEMCIISELICNDLMSSSNHFWSDLQWFDDHQDDFWCDTWHNLIWWHKDAIVNASILQLWKNKKNQTMMRQKSCKYWYNNAVDVSSKQIHFCSMSLSGLATALDPIYICLSETENVYLWSDQIDSCVKIMIVPCS